MCWREQPALVHNTPLVLSALVQTGGSTRDSCLHSAEEAAAKDRFAYLGPKMPVLPLCLHLSTVAGTAQCTPLDYVLQFEN